MIFWKEACGGEIPEGAAVAGFEADGTPLFIARAEYKDSLQLGKVRPEFGAANIPYGGEEVKVNPYEVLMGAAHWKPAVNGNIPDGAVVAGHEKDGQPLYVARAVYMGGVHPGKVRLAFGAANIPYGGEEVKVNPYEVLVYED
jgi:hypothetical protein